MKLSQKDSMFNLSCLWSERRSTGASAAQTAVALNVTLTPCLLLYVQALAGLSHMAVWVQLPMVGQAAAGSSSSGSFDAAFDCWCHMFQLCEQNTLLGKCPPLQMARSKVPCNY